MNHIAPPPEDAWEVLSPILTPARREKLLAAAHQRTNYVRLVAQDVHDPHNVSACMRSAEAFGIQNVDVVELGKPFRPSKVARGVTNWVNTQTHDTVADCAKVLKQGGYKLYAGMPDPSSIPLDELPLDQPIAVLFGNEHAGVDPSWKQHCDGFFTIPMVGMVESMNISVCAAITMHHLTHKCRQAKVESFFLSEEERSILLNEWVVSKIEKWEEKYEKEKTSKS